MKKNLLLFAVTAVLLLGSNLIQAQNPRRVFDFETLSMPDTGFWNGADTTVYKNHFGDNIISFPNSYDPNYGGWNEFAFSSWTDTITEGYLNQWSTYAGKAHSDSTFGLCYITTDWNNNYQTIPVEINFSEKISPEYFYITNSTYTALAIKEGNPYSRAFRTDSQDYYKIIIKAYNNDTEVGSTEVFLADYRSQDSSIVKAWKKVDLSGFGEITKLSFDAQTTDIGTYGPNTPLYFCMDDFVYSIATSLTENKQSIVSIYPNPASDYIRINSNVESIQIFDLSGRIVKNLKLNQKNPTISISDLQSNTTYFIRIKNKKGIKNGKFVKL